MKQYGGFWVRVAAAIIDGVVLTAAQWVVMLVFGGMFAGLFGMAGGLGATPEEAAAGALAGALAGMSISMAVMTALSILYYVIGEGVYRRTLGKLAVGLLVVDAASGEAIGVGRAFLRYLVKVVNWILLGIPFVVLAFREDKRGLHDFAAGSAVVHGSSLPVAPPAAAG